MDTEKRIGTTDVAKITGANVQTVQRWLRNKTLRSSKRTKGLRYFYSIKIADLIEFCEKKGITPDFTGF